MKKLDRQTLHSGTYKSLQIDKIVIRNLKDLIKIKNEWKRLEKGTDMTVYQSFEWNCLLFEKWKSYFINRLFSECVVYVVRKDESIEFIAPLIVKKRTLSSETLGFDKGVYFLGNGTHSDYLSFIYFHFNEVSLACLITEIQNDYNGFPLYFNQIRSKSLLASYFVLMNIQKTVWNTVSISIPETEERYKEVLSKSVKQNIRTAFNRMSKDGISYKLKVLVGTLDNATIDLMTTMHQNRAESLWNRVYNSINSSDIKYRMIKLRQHENRLAKKYDLIAQSMAMIESSFCIIIELNNTIAGFLYCLRDEKSIRVIYNCFNEKYSFYSPNTSGIYDFIIKECSNHKYGIDKIDFTLGEEEYKYKLGGKQEQVYNFIFGEDSSTAKKTKDNQHFLKYRIKRVFIKRKVRKFSELKSCMKK